MTESRHATSSGTSGYAERMVQRGLDGGHFRSDDRWTYASIGMGTYLGDSDDKTDRKVRDAVLRALADGCNVIDTAINYRCQRSERIIGQALGEAVAGGIVRREEVIISTKGGYLPFDGESPADPTVYVQETFIRTGLLKEGDIVAKCHAMTPTFIQDQMARSLRNLALPCIDVYYLHNPETQLQEVTREEFRKRIRKAFLALEDGVSQGKIRVYGTATWDGYRVPPTARDHLSLEELVGIAQEIGGSNHHFRVVQLPYNLAMPEALTEPTQRVGLETVCLLEAADRLGIYVMASAPLYQGRLTRKLPPILEAIFPDLRTDAQRAIQFVRSTPKMGTALVGMKTTSHVEENLKVATVPPVAVEEFMKLFHTEG